MSIWLKIAMIGVAGAGGALSRYGITQLCAWIFKGWPTPGWVWGTLAANVIGCLLFGLVWALTEDRWNGAVEIRYIVLVGFLGSFTTFSTFAFEGMGFAVNHRYGMVAIHLLSHMILGLFAVWLGMWLGGRTPEL